MPKKKIEERFDALMSGDFSTLYRSYHPRAPFMQQFPTEEDYLCFASRHLARMVVSQTHIGDSREADGGSEVLCGLVFELDGRRQVLYELALLLPSAEGWRYHSAQKLSVDQFRGTFAQLDFVLFDDQPKKIRF